MYEDFPGFFTKMKILEGVRGRFLSAGHYEGGVAPAALGIVLVVFLSQPSQAGLIFVAPAALQEEI